MVAKGASIGWGILLYPSDLEKKRGKMKVTRKKRLRVQVSSLSFTLLGERFDRNVGKQEKPGSLPRVPMTKKMSII